MILEGKKVLVVGLARSGIAAARLLASRGAVVTANDSKNDPGPEAAELAALGVNVIGGGHPESLFLEADLIVLSPGVPTDLPVLKRARDAGIRMIREVELRGSFIKGRLIGVTGSNGKTTTTTLIGELLEALDEDVVMGGNIGYPLAGLVDRTTNDSWTVAELSSFQLESIDRLHVDVAVVTNVTPDHLDRHPSFEAYVDAKKRIFENQTESDWAVLNGCDDVVTRMGAAAVSRRVFFSSAGREVAPGAAGIYVRDGFIRCDLLGDRGEIPVIALDDISLPGLHNVENVMAALAAAFCARGMRAEDVPELRRKIKEFKGVEHRIEFVAEIDGVRFYNDSKATNVDSTQKGLEAFARNVILILGGKDKGSDYTVLSPLIKMRVKQIVLLGAASDKIAGQLHGTAPMVRAGSMEEVVRRSIDLASSGDTVLLSPACASFDMFENYEHRGRVFKEEVMKRVAESRRSE